MKPIETINIRRDGKTIEANTIDMRLVGDNLSDSCTVFYELFQKNLEEIENIVDGETVTVEIPTYISLATGNVTIAWEDYTNLDTANGVDINEEIYKFVAKELNVELV